MLSIQEVCVAFASHLGSSVQVRGRIISVRQMRKSVFADLSSNGFKLQCRFEPNSDFIPHNGDLVEVAGNCIYTKSGESTIDVSSATVIGKWSAEVDYKKVSEGKNGQLSAFLPEARGQFHFSQAVRNHIRHFLTSEEYFEVQTPILGRNYNGGKSFPVASFYLNNRIGFNRTTMEDRMQALVAMGYERVFQIGSVFRSDKELTFLEGYEAYTDWEEGKQRIKLMLSYVVKKLIEEGIGDSNNASDNIVFCNWLELDFSAGVCELTKLASEEVLTAGKGVAELIRLAGLVKNGDTSPETVADELANAVAERTGVPTIINGFPIWSSPLYAVCKRDDCKLVRSRMYIPGQKGGFEIGIQENDYDNFVRRMAEQRKVWNLADGDERIGDSDLAKTLSGGLPPIFGFGLNPDRIVKIWRQNSSIDPYQVN